MLERTKSDAAAKEEELTNQLDQLREQHAEAI
jgi:hypothetical protein